MSTTKAQSLLKYARLRWYQYRLRTLLLAPIVVAVVFSWPHLHRRYIVWRLQGYAGTDLQKLSEVEKLRVDQWIEGLVGGNPDHPRAFFPKENRLIHFASVEGGENRLVVVQMEPTPIIPGSSYCHLHILDSWGRPVGSLHFNVGYRAWPQAASFDQSRGFLCLVVETDGVWSGGTRQFYRITDKYAELLRSELLSGGVEIGRGTVFDIDEKPSDWSDWRSLLGSPDRLQQLRGLAAFCSCRNLDRLECIDGGLHLRLEELSKSSDPWISEQAEAVLHRLADWGKLPVANTVPSHGRPATIADGK